MRRFKGPPPFLFGDKARAAQYIHYAKRKAATLPRSIFARREGLHQQGITIHYTRIGKFWRIAIRAEHTGNVVYEFFVPVASNTIRARFLRSVPDTAYTVAACQLSYFDGRFDTTPVFATDYSGTDAYAADRLPYDTVQGESLTVSLAAADASASSVAGMGLIDGHRQGYSWWGSDGSLLVSEAGSYPGGESGLGLGAVNAQFAFPLRAPVPDASFDGLEAAGTVDAVRGVRITYWQQAPDALIRSQAGRAPQLISEGGAAEVNVPSGAWKVRRVIRRTVTHTEHGSRTFLIAADSNGGFHVWPEGDTASAVDLSITWPAWVALDSSGAPFDHLDWCFNAAGTKAVALPFESAAVTASGSLRLFGNGIYSDATLAGAGITPGDYTTAKLHAPGVLEISLSIDLTGPESDAFDAAVEILAATAPADLGFWPVAADYAFDDPKLSALGVPADTLVFATLTVQASAAFVAAASTGNGQSGALYTRIGFRTLANAIIDYPLDELSVSISSATTVINDALTFASGFPVGYAPWSANLGHVLGLDCRALALCLSKFRADYPDYDAGQLQPSNITAGAVLYAYGETVYTTGDSFNSEPAATLETLASTDFRAIYTGMQRAVFKSAGWTAIRVHPDGHLAAIGEHVMGAVVGGTPNIIDENSPILRLYWGQLVKDGDSVLNGWAGGEPVYCEGIDVIALREGDSYSVLTHKTVARFVDAAADYDNYRCLFDAEFELWRDSLPPEEANAIVRGQKVGGIGSLAITGYFH